MGIKHGTKIGSKRWVDFTADEIAKKMLHDAKSAHVHLASEDQGVCLLKCGKKIAKGQKYIRHSGIKKRIVHLKCAENIAQSTTVALDPNKQPAIENIEKINSVTVQVHAAKSIDRDAFSMGYLACVHKMFEALASNPEAMLVIATKICPGVDDAFNRSLISVPDRTEAIQRQ